jgi:hypothetical protein
VVWPAGAASTKCCGYVRYPERGVTAQLGQGYHKKDMDFSSVQASGVSRILLKGQSYSTPPGTKTSELLL